VTRACDPACLSVGGGVSDDYCLLTGGECRRKLEELGQTRPTAASVHLFQVERKKVDDTEGGTCD
jgi:hypothetical protein